MLGWGSWKPETNHQARNTKLREVFDLPSVPPPRTGILLNGIVPFALCVDWSGCSMIASRKLVVASVFFFLSLSLADSLQPRYRISMCTNPDSHPFRIQGPRFFEWMEYHRSIGVEHFYVYLHHDTVNNTMSLMPYIEAGLVTLVPWRFNRFAQVRCFLPSIFWWFFSSRGTGGGGFAQNLRRLLLCVFHPVDSTSSLAQCTRPRHT